MSYEGQEVLHNSEAPGGILSVILTPTKTSVFLDPGGAHRSWSDCPCPESPALALWKPQCVLTLDVPISRLEGLAGWWPVDKEGTCQQEPFRLFLLQFRATLQPTGRGIIETDLLKYNSRLIL